MQVDAVPSGIYGLSERLALGQHKKPCPLCQDRRQKHRKDRPLSIEILTDGVRYFCHHCNAEGGWYDDDVKPKEVFVPQPRRDPIAVEDPRDDVLEEVLDYLVSRGINREVAEAHTIASKRYYSGGERVSVGFPYYDSNDTVVAVKWRSASADKMFTQQGTCETLFLMHTHEPGNDILICEGELDALAWRCADLPENITVTSIPNGAPAKLGDGPATNEGKWRYLEYAEEHIANAGRIYLSFDNDGPGKILSEEIERRVPKSKIWSISLADYKDAAEAILTEGSGFLDNAFHNAEPIPMIGLHGTDRFYDTFVGLYNGDIPKGWSTGLSSLDEIFTVNAGMMTVATGYPGSGKSELIDQICVNIALSQGIRTAFCSFEKPGEFHMIQLAQKIVGKTFFDGNTERMTPAERDFARDVIEDNFIFMDHRHDGPTTIGGILEKASAAVLRKGIRNLVIDPYNWIDLKDVEGSDGRETSAITAMLTLVQQWAKTHMCHVFFVAHPRHASNDQLGKKIVPTGKTISGSNAWFSKADFGLSMWRDEHNPRQPPECHIWKVKWAWMGELGNVALDYDVPSGRYSNSSGYHDDYDFDWIGREDA